MTPVLFLSVAALHLLAAISPGPAVLMAARTGVTEGLRTGAALSVGIGVGAIIWATTALFGLAVIFQLAPALLTGFKIVGGLYLAWMGWQMWRAAAVPLDLADTGRPPRSLGSAFLLGVGTQLANPKPAVFFGAVFVGTIPPGTNAAVYAALLSVIFLNEALWNILVARIFSLDRARRGYIGLKSVIDRCFGGLLGLLGLKIALT